MVVFQPQVVAHEDVDSEGQNDAKAAVFFENTGDRDMIIKDHFKYSNGIRFAGMHLIVDMWGLDHLDNTDFLRECLIDAVKASRATLLHIHLHRFSPHGGVSGVAVLAESHISVHTWTERGYAAFDVFMCGKAEPDAAVEMLKQRLDPRRIEITEHRRGTIEE